MLNLSLFLCAFCCLTTSGAFANILLIGNDTNLSFNAVAAKFGRPVNGSGEHGTIFVASPLNACSPLTNSNNLSKDSGYLLIIRGECDFEKKVRRAQDAGFKAAIVYNNEDTSLIPMGGNSTGIHIPAVFVSQSTGLKLQKYVGRTEIEVWLVQSYGNSAWSIMAMSFISLLALSAALAICFFVRRHGIGRDHSRQPRVRVFRGMSSRLVKEMPSLEFTEDLEDNCTSATCAICLDDYNVGDKIRILPCRHKFHMICVDAWLTSWRTFCPICKRDANTTISDPPATERTPLLSSTPASMASSTLLSSVRSSSYVSSRPMQIGRSPTSLSYTPRQSYQSYHESHYPSSAQSSLGIRNASSSYRSRGSHFNSNSFASPSLSPVNSIYTAFYSNSGNGSSSYVRYSSQQAQSLLRRESAAQSPLEC